MTINIYLLSALLIVVGLIVPTTVFFCVKDRRKLKICAIVFLFCYLILVGFGVFGTVNFSGDNVSLHLKFDGKWFEADEFAVYAFGIKNILINLAMFVPVGMTSFVLFDGSWWKCLLFSFVLSGLIEFGQFALPVKRVVELTDLVYNTISGMLGFLSFFFLSKLKSKH